MKAPDPAPHGGAAHATIRRCGPRDREAVLEVWDEASRIAHAFLPEDFFAREREAIRSAYLPKAETWVLEDGGRVAGFISLLDDFVGGLFVRPGLQGRGIGRRLLDHARATRPRLEVEVFEANATGRAFYEAYGFAVVDARQHRETGHTLLRMRLGG